jgi:HD superfamily phosphodiesterase
MFEQIKKQIVGFFDKNSSHDLDHTMRVYNMCIYIGKKE